MTRYTLHQSRLALIEHPVVIWCDLHSIKWVYVWIRIAVHIENEIDNVAFKLKFGQYILFEESI